MSLLSKPYFADHLATLSGRWSDAMDATNSDCVVVAAGSNTNYFLDDQAPPFRPNPHFAQWFPADGTEHCELILKPAEKPVLLFYQPADFWHLPPSVPDWAAAHYRLEVHSSIDKLAASRDQHIKGQNSTAWIGPGDGPESIAGEHYNPAPLLAHLDFQRSTKTAFEIAAMRAATGAAVTGHVAARDAFFAGQTEYEIYMAFLAATGNTGAQLPYSSIVALNEHAGVLHYQHYDRQPPEAHLSFLIDAGASHLGYASDITRTYSSAQQPIGQQTPAPAEFGELIIALDRCQLALIDSIQVGQGYADLHETMINHIAAILCDHKILQCGPDEAIENGYADPFMPHGLGHLIGLQTHDVGGQLADARGTPAPPDERFPALRLTRPLEADAVFTIEPGIYFIPMLLDEQRSTTSPINWSLIDALLPCGGIRIEDNIWLTEDGAVNLTREAFNAL